VAAQAGLGRDAGTAATQSETAVLERATKHRSEFMRPWETMPQSVAHGILDDETYDWWRS